MPRLRIAQTWDGAEVGPREVTTVELAAIAGGLEVRVEAPFHDDPAPAAPAGPTDRLWEHEVVELFLVAAGSDPPEYTEIELGPHGHHLVLRLRGVRHRVAGPLAIEYRARIAGDSWRGRAVIPEAHLPPAPHRINAYAIHGLGDRRRHLAWRPVPGPAPDFHRLECFAPLALDLGLDVGRDLGHDRDDAAS